MTLRNAIAAIALVAIVLVLVKFAGKQASGAMRQIRFNYQSGTLLEATVQTSSSDTSVTWTLIPPGGYDRVWSTRQPASVLRSDSAVSTIVDILTAQLAESDHR